MVSSGEKDADVKEMTALKENPEGHMAGRPR